MQISVNVLGRRGPDAACACLAHLRGRLPEGMRLRLLDDSPHPAVARAFPAAEIVRLPGGRGSSGAHNRGLRRAVTDGDDAVLLLSVDARPTAGFLAPLLEVMKMRPRAAFVSPKILLARSPRQIWYAGGRIDWWRGLAIRRGAGTTDDGRFDRPAPTDFATAVTMLVRRQAFDRTGAMDESYVDHLHDVDWSVRARAVGMEVHYQPRSRVLYAAPDADRMDPWARIAPPRESPRELRRSRLRLVANHGRWYHWPTVAPRVAADATTTALRATTTALRGWRRLGSPSQPAPAGRAPERADRAPGGRGPYAG